jgi:ABC-type nitrate/sulfonate/bicarbonate transport system substrate-binding protein
VVRTIRFLSQTTIAALMLLSAAAATAFGAEPVELTLGVSSSGLTVFAVWMAEAGGFYKKEGLNVHVVNLEGGTRGLQVLLAGKIQAVHAGLGPLTQANREGADLRMIASTTRSIPFAFFAAPEIKTAADLRGGVVAVATFGSEGDIATTMALQRLGLGRKEVVVVQVGEFSKRFAVLLSGQAKATMLVEPASTIARERGLTQLFDLAAAKIPWVSAGLTVRRAALQTQRDLLARLIRAEVEAAFFAAANERSSKELIAQKFKTDDPKAIDATYRDFKRIVQLDAEPSAAGAANVFKELEAIGIAVGSRNVEDYIDYSILRSLAKVGFFDAMKRKYSFQ